ncbi:MAG: Zn-dependent hydrolase [Lysobacterales bacterium 69-70]|nr:Zn-dependent hydrolase [Xanthomonadaceae bacterium]ODU32772.1 MAG: Zn-dependent hydrolase [Xanthomonadaceae bacterium SCN 69-320]ODV15962.1 MAG: Zn-dependent hydrolase [Xanthomonadaceae bacterium SCN 69-25]OJY99902.1 MAG: Zn-dependent hydrolase [Xanthomonadales bacterium 69-70]
MNAIPKNSADATAAPLRVNGRRLWDSLMEMAQIGATPKGGVCRLALTDLDKQGRDLFVRWAKEAGCTITVDQMGNVFARRAGRDDSLAPVVTGSHADSQPTGGKFDGIYGVLGGLEVIRSLNDHGIETDRPVEVVIWTNEEGSRFAPAMVSSGVFAGVFTLDYGLSRADVDGKTMGEELARIGYAGDAPVGKPIHAAFELHIEQGPILEAEDVTIGVVHAAQGQRWYEVVLTGQESHAGPTPMPRRRDALLGAAKVIQLVNAIGHKYAPYACATVGMLQVHPNSRNVIPGRVFFTVDLRHPEDAVLAQMDADLRAGIAAAADEARVEVSKLEQIFYYAPVAFDADCVASVRAGAQKFGYSHRDIVSGAGHDACYLAQVAPTAMVFVPCIGGISHNEIEDATPEWIEAGANVLLHAMLGRAGR